MLILILLRAILISRMSLVLENLALRQHVAVLERSVPRRPGLRHLTKYLFPRFCPRVLSFFAASRFAIGFLSTPVSVRRALPISSRR
jgi:hypothetical protein